MNKCVVSLTSSKETLTFFVYHRYRCFRLKEFIFFMKPFSFESQSSHCKPISHHFLSDLHLSEDCLHLTTTVLQSNCLEQPACRMSQEHKGVGTGAGRFEGDIQKAESSPSLDARLPRKLNEAPGQRFERIGQSRRCGRSRRRKEICPSPASKSHREANEKPFRRRD